MQAVFLELIKLSLIGSLFAGAVMLVRLIFPKTPKWIFCLLWGVVALRLICPLSIESSLSLVPDRIASGQIIASVGNEYIGDVDIIRENDAAYDSAVEAGRQPVYSEDGYYVVTEKDSLEIPKTVGETLYPVLSWIWAVGTVSMLIYTVVSFLVLRRKMAEATRLRDNIWQCERVDSPFVLGFIKPRIYLPYSFTDSDMANVIAHEQAHIHRRDHWWKPIGFVLLSLHWFNPVLWLAYVMLCRDIEAACDEKVIKHMEKDEMRAYSTALLNCSVNRRRIAACPLAFGEVGVKERVKTVMNYKKPAFWIVIAAVALCIVVAVCFLTNPKDYGPEVGNPKLLEFPGIQWFVTPDELKEALNITDEQIINESTELENEDVVGDYDIYTLSVTDLTLFGKEVPYVFFNFNRYPGFDFAFDYAVVMFDEDTDMVQLKAEVSEIYGPGFDETFTYNTYYETTERTYHSRAQEFMITLSRIGPDIYDLEDNPWLDALDDPDYTTHHWTTKNGASVIPPEVLEYTMDQPWNGDNPLPEDGLVEWVDQYPWVMVSMSNRHPSVITRDAVGVEDDQSPSLYYTNNCMEFDAQRLWQYFHDAKAARMADPSMLEFPGLKWGASVEEVKDALNLTEEQISTDEQLDSDLYLLHVKDITFFGEDVSIGLFKFLPVDAENFGLSYVMLFLDEDTDMDKLQTTLSDSYNNQGTGEYFMGYSLSTGSAIHSNVDPDELEYKLYEYKRCLDWKVDDNGNFQSGSIFAQEQAKIIFEKINEPGLKTYNWVSPVKAAEVIDPEDLDAIKEAYERYLDIDPSLTGEWLEKSPLVHMSMANRSEQAIRAELEGVTEGELTLATNNIVVLDAQMLFELQNDILQAQQALNNPTDDTTLPTDPPVTPATQSEILASIPDVDEVSMLCFPGLKWGDSVETVKTVLGVTEDQIKLDEPYGEAYGLWLENVSFFGGDVANGQFTFFEKNGEYYLESIKLYYVDGTDMTAVEDALRDHYGAPKDGEGFTSYTISNGTVKSHTELTFTYDFDKDKTKVKSWWESAAKRADLLPADVQEAMIETGHVTYYTERLDPADPTTRPLIQEYLNSNPAVVLYCTNGEKLGQIPYTKNVVSFSAHTYVYQLLYCR